jgi:hypothetical protein
MFFQPKVEDQDINPGACDIRALEPQPPNAFPPFTVVHGLGARSAFARSCNAGHILGSSGTLPARPNGWRPTKGSPALFVPSTAEAPSP